jgi:putative tryptophan/tyrosine transport system substrate-binding protein
MSDMKRRQFITMLGGAAVAWPLAARAQQDGRMRRIGVLMSGAEADTELQARVKAFRQTLEQYGWSEGRNIRIDIRFSAIRSDEYQALAKEMVALQPDVIFGHTTPVVVALQRESRTVPIVFVNVSDPLGSGLVTSLAHPGGNITGLMLDEEGITGKWLALLKEIAPHLRRAALMANPISTPYDYFVRSAKSVAPSLALELVPSPINDAADIERTIESFARLPDGGLVVLPDGTSILHRDLIIALAARHRLPTVYAHRFFVAAGGLMSYATDVIDQNRRAASYVDRILRGAKPADLPVQAPTKYETTVNLKTARALGLDVPPSLLVRADEVIE